MRLNARSRWFPEPEFGRSAAERWLLLQLRALRARLRPAEIGSIAPRASALAGAVPGYLVQAAGYLRGQLRRFG